MAHLSSCLQSSSASGTFQISQFLTSDVVQLVKNLPAKQETWVQSLGREDPLEKGIATPSSILAWKIPEQRSLVGYGPYGCGKLDMTEVT